MLAYWIVWIVIAFVWGFCAGSVVATHTIKKALKR